MQDKSISAIFRILYSEYGPQHWWPAETPFEVCVGAILTQNTSWKNVEKAIARMKKMRLMDKRAIIAVDSHKLQDAIRPSGFYVQKAKILKEFCEKVDFGQIEKMDVHAARDYLLSIKGIGRETADSILLYAFRKPIFIVDAYTKRIYWRIKGEYIWDYDELRKIFESSLGKSTQKYNEMHALLVEHAKLYCIKNNPKCISCPLLEMCSHGTDRIGKKRYNL